MAGAWRSVESRAEVVVEELRRFVKSTGRGPHIEGPPELQRALDLLCQRLKENARGKTTDGHKRPLRTVGATLKEWCPAELLNNHG